MDNVESRNKGLGGPYIPISRFNSACGEYPFPVNLNPDSPIGFNVNEGFNHFRSQCLGIEAFLLTNFLHITCIRFQIRKNSSLKALWNLSSGVPIVLIFGGQVLHENGVPATYGGFIQLPGTTSGSTRMREAAAANCLGGDMNTVAQPLKEIKVKFGEVVSMRREVNGDLVRRAGFGVEDETALLMKGERYGVVGDGIHEL